MILCIVARGEQPETLALPKRARYRGEYPLSRLPMEAKS